MRTNILRCTRCYLVKCSLRRCNFNFFRVIHAQKLLYTLILEQDHGLEALSHVISRQKAMAVDIGNELDTQNGKWNMKHSLIKHKMSLFCSVFDRT